MKRTPRDHVMADIVPNRPDPDIAVRESALRKRDVGRGQSPRRMQKPTIYFAGRMGGAKGNWRDELGEIPPAAAAAMRDYLGFHRDAIVDCRTFRYGGPFVIDTMGRRTRIHCGYFNDHSVSERRQIWDADKFWIERADLIVAYIKDMHAYGTLVEIGYAAAKDKPIALGFSHDMAHADYVELWFCRMPAAKVYWGAPEEVWKEIQHDWIKTLNPRRAADHTLCRTIAAWWDRRTPPPA
jgi:nucleoside 2-deoxyribosyltransferase-like protein